MKSKTVSNIIQRGGSILKAGRCEKMRTDEGLRQACQRVNEMDIDGMIVIGGDGTFKGAKAISEHCDVPFIGIPGTIDNDLYGTDFTIGYDTAINTALDAIDKIRDTANSHDRLFFIEVMGRDAGFIALRSGIGGGAESILLPETKTEIDQLISDLDDLRKLKKTSMIVLVAEGDETGGAFKAAEEVNKKFRYYDTRVVVLGHMQRGGSPTCMDRTLATRLGVAGVEALMDGRRNIMVGTKHLEYTYVPFSKATKHHSGVDKNLLRIARMMAS